MKGVPIFADEDCAERLWSVNASIQGGSGVFFGESTSACSPRRCRLNLRASNTFYSQWCAPPDSAEFQVSSVRPSRNLLGEAADAEQRSVFDRSFAVARIGTRIGVDAETLEDPDYTDGASTELAARGLYGRYALFLPKDSISWVLEGGGRTDGLVLDQVDDVLLRVDYTSIAR